ncbi:ANTAR domain-containing response regulator [Rubrimonas cliftonensis]|uniref:Two-component response regulator, AmiR/NasT family, consists of REC and RNA-binding antiterminator (ANTAR) domains n=1 Tax=Rubrimonas cliftonensis TaxID=89524 RepID=A0A1H3Z3X9_9RHOB|nr:ANTAR domain-containing protein [Rubrimonas cliftonensis]SEA18178.1 Two-component response regulator, AmiR/NasT family, consists of REC and RNA-binding antiterminator (ANTAR) domains [Rubrimonas cliftonensis]
MKRAAIQNFRGYRALVLHREDASRDVLMSVLGKLGLAVEAVDPAALTDAALPECDLILFDADDEIEALGGRDAADAPPTIALIGHEAPSRLARVVRRRCASHILKPVRSSGVFTAVYLAVNEHARRQREARETEAMRQRLAGRRVVTAAILRMVLDDGLDQDAAYERLRAEAMRRRIPVDEMARDYLARGNGARQSPRTAGLTRNA